MPASVLFDASASREYLQARRWYAARSGEQIAAAFADEVDRVVVRIAETPKTRKPEPSSEHTIIGSD